MSICKLVNLAYKYSLPASISNIEPISAFMKILRLIFRIPLFKLQLGLGLGLQLRGSLLLQAPRN